MQITVTARNTELTDPLRDYAREKVAKLEEFFKNIQKIEVVLEIKDSAAAEKRQIAEIRAWLAGLKMIQAVEGARDMYSAIDLALDEAKGQIEKHKEKMTKEKHRQGSKFKQQLNEQNLKANESL